MNREAQSIVLLLVGGAVLRISLSDIHLRYVKAGLQPYLVVAGALLVVIAAATLWRELFGHRSAGGAHDGADGDDGGVDVGAELHDGHGHGSGGPRVAWLLTLPVFAVFLVAPPSLGAYSASREGTTAVAKPSSDFVPLPAGDPVRMTVVDYVTRAIWDKGASLKGRQVSLTGFVTPGPDGRIYLTRIALSCCAADGRPLKVALRGDVPGGLPADTWITVVGEYHPHTEKDPANEGTITSLQVTRLDQVPPPKQPYES